MELANSRKTLMVVATTAIFILALVAAYFYFFPAINKQIVQAEEQLKLEEKLLEAVQNQQQTNKVEISPNELRALQRQVPVKPLVDQFIFDLEKAEIYSDSFILNYGFGAGQYSGSGITITNDEEEAEEETEQTANQFNSERITVNMSVITPGYDELIQFLERIEQLERITKIDQLSFTGYPEVRLLEQTADDFTFSITISTFYLPELEEFAQYLPQINYPERGKRYNPLHYGVKEDNNNEQDE